MFTYLLVSLKHRQLTDVLYRSLSCASLSSWLRVSACRSLCQVILGKYFLHFPWGFYFEGLSGDLTLVHGAYAQTIPHRLTTFIPQP